MVGDKINDGELVERVNGRLWKIRCECGTIFIAQPSDSNGRCKECGYKHLSQERTIHGDAPSLDRNAPRLYSIWVGMRNRCYNPSNEAYKHYGGRGIVVCREWDDYLSFKTWAMSHGYNDRLTLDRINVNGNYEPNNCRWSTQSEQMRNKRSNVLITYNGETKTMVEWSQICGIPYSTLKRRIRRYGFSVEEALTIPARRGNNQNLRKTPFVQINNTDKE